MNIHFSRYVFLFLLTSVNSVPYVVCVICLFIYLNVCLMFSYVIWV